jgi:hypothetical protein
MHRHAGNKKEALKFLRKAEELAHPEMHKNLIRKKISNIQKDEKA